MNNLFVIGAIFCDHVGYILHPSGHPMLKICDPCAPHIQRGASNSKKSPRYDDLSENAHIQRGTSNSKKSPRYDNLSENAREVRKFSDLLAHFGANFDKDAVVLSVI